MADAADKNETPVVEKITAEDVDSKELAEEVDASSENSTEEFVAATENTDSTGDADVSDQAPDTANGEKGDDDAAADGEDSAEKNGENKRVAKEANGEATDAVKRKVVADSDGKVDDTVPTPEKKAKLDDSASKEEAQNGAEGTEIAA
ncbi:protein starmaker [Teleopsis dalmanni]|uniref:protein starmaker n=1 Tax=Teleopsis dalmanni TaxID=139649 RepID=UPI0018CDE968|nr:protein starmaker [Teleopsis dalmanni]